MHWRKERPKHKEKEAQRPGWKYKGDTEPPSLQHPQTPAAPFQFALRGLRAVTLKIRRTLSFLRGLCPPGLSLNLTGSKGWAPVRLSQLWPCNTLNCGKPDIMPQTLLASVTEDRPCVIPLLPQRFFCLEFLPKAKPVTRTPQEVSGALLWRQSRPPPALPPQRQLPRWAQSLSSPGSAGLQHLRVAGAREWAAGSSLQGWGLLLLQCHRHRDLHQQGQLGAATTQPRSLGFP